MEMVLLLLLLVSGGKSSETTREKRHMDGYKPLVQSDDRTYLVRKMPRPLWGQRRDSREMTEETGKSSALTQRRGCVVVDIGPKGSVYAHSTAV